MSAASPLVPGVQGVRAGPLAGLLVETFDVALQLAAIDPPDPPAPDLHGGQGSGPYQRVNLRNAHVEIDGDVLERHEPGLHR